MRDTSQPIQPDRGQPAIALHLVNPATFDSWLAGQNAATKAQIVGQKFAAKPDTLAIIPAKDMKDMGGDGWGAVVGVNDPARLTSWCLARAAEALPAGSYRLAAGDDAPALIGWALGQYRFDRYRREAGSAELGGGPRVLLSANAKAIPTALAEAAAVSLVRDLVNTPAEEMGPRELEAEVERLGRQAAGGYQAEVKVTRGEALEREFPCVHAVGRAAGRSHAPRMIELVWGAPGDPRIAIVGKGVAFDSGGLDIKPASGMALMKKDMGGAAHAIALAQLVMASGLRVRLHLLIPAVENAISGNAFRPGDVLRSRAGLSIEIGNTDAEGRLILADALARASEPILEPARASEPILETARAGEEQPALILDFATLTGAARVALGPDLPALFARDEATANALLAAGMARDDPLWRLPLHDGYREYLKSDIADLNNSPTIAGNGGFAGAVAAALFLDRFVPAGIDWAHFDTFAWRPAAKPGRPKGGDALGLRASWAMLQARFG